MSRIKPLLSVSIGHGRDIDELITIPPGFTVYRVAYYADLAVVPDYLLSELVFNGRAFSGEEEILDFFYARKQTRYSFCVQVEGTVVYNAEYSYGPEDPYFNCLGIINKSKNIGEIPEEMRAVIPFKPDVAKKMYMNTRIDDAATAIANLREEGVIINQILLRGKWGNTLKLQDLFELYEREPNSHIYIILWSCRSSGVKRTHGEFEPRLVADLPFYQKNPKLNFMVEKTTCSEIGARQLDALNAALRKSCFADSNICVSKYSHIIVVTAGGAPVSFLTIEPIHLSDELNLFILYNVCTVVGERRKGFSRLLLNHAFYHILSKTRSEAQNYVFLFPDPANESALTKMYKQYGFLPVTEYVDENSEAQAELARRFYSSILPLNPSGKWMVYNVAFQKRIWRAKITLM